MFLKKTQERNSALINTVKKLHQEGSLNPDTYVIDLDTLEMNARKISNEAKRLGLKLYAMTKQIGRNPEIARRLLENGFESIVAVDPWEALVLARAGIPLGHVGHLVQIPDNMLEEIMSYRPEVITVFSLYKAKKISEIAKKNGIQQKLLIRVVGDSDRLYIGQEGGFIESQWIEVSRQISKLDNIILEGLTAFPCFLYEDGEVKATENVHTIKRAAKIIESTLDIKLNQLNMPSVNSFKTLSMVKENGGTHAEPGHALTGTTPLHAVLDLAEVPAIVYLSEISHFFKDKAYVFGGGFYKRSHQERAIVINKSGHKTIVNSNDASQSMIDYYGEIDIDESKAGVGDTVIYAFRTQIFTTRSTVALVEGIQSGNPNLVGLYDALGRKKRL